jgi:hypothetical protein
VVLGSGGGCDGGAGAVSGNVLCEYEDGRTAEWSKEMNSIDHETMRIEPTMLMSSLEKGRAKGIDDVVKDL